METAASDFSFTKSEAAVFFSSIQLSGLPGEEQPQRLILGIHADPHDFLQCEVVDGPLCCCDDLGVDCLQSFHISAAHVDVVHPASWEDEAVGQP